MTTQMNLFSFGPRSGETPTFTIKPCDTVIAAPKFGDTRYIVTAVSDNIHGPVYVCTSTADGSEAIIMHREVSVHIRHTPKNGSGRINCP